jgi:hypothetical protein
MLAGDALNAIFETWADLASTDHSAIGRKAFATNGLE